ncbi:MAG: alanine racemase [Anaerolineaceae bacterium]|nr:alanine racemase [Anaerolineaceae bacterium]
MHLFDQIQTPTLLINEKQTRDNIKWMVEKAARNSIRLRPHFKTHQSAEIAGWFREQGIQQCTVSSISMAGYFARYGWQDITIAFPVNPREMTTLKQLRETISTLGLLVECSEIVERLEAELESPTEIWIKVDCGNHRTGILWNDGDGLRNVAQAVRSCKKLHLRGLLSHFGDSYHAVGRSAVTSLYQESLSRLQQARNTLLGAGFEAIELSIGDTPSCSLVDALGTVDEMRPGNFVFYDTMQLAIGSCIGEQISVALACPIVALHPERNEVVIYGGAIHLSKDNHSYAGQAVVFGLPALPTKTGWGAPLAGGYVRSLSQEHGVVRLAPEHLSSLKIGDLLMILPAHSCLTLQAMRTLKTLDGRIIETMLSESDA